MPSFREPHDPLKGRLPVGEGWKRFEDLPLQSGGAAIDVELGLEP
jgi:hypothetical protein